MFYSIEEYEYETGKVLAANEGIKLKKNILPVYRKILRNTKCPIHKVHPRLLWAYNPIPYEDGKRTRIYLANECCPEMLKVTTDKLKISLGDDFKQGVFHNSEV